MDQNQQQTEVELVPPVSDRVVWKRDAHACVVEIDCDVMAQPIPGGHIVQQGVHRYLVAKSDLPIIQSHSYLRSDEDRQFRRLAEETFAREFQHHTDDDPLAQKLRQEGDEAGATKRIEDLKKMWGASVEAIYNRDYRRPWPPFERVSVVEDHLANPADQERIAEQTDLIERERAARQSEAVTSASAVAVAVAEAMKPIVELITAQLQQQSSTTKKGGG